MRDLIAALLILLPVPSRAAAAAATPDLAVTNVTVIDMTGAPPRAGMTVVVRGARILAVGEASGVEVPKAALVVDGSGKFLMPAFWDMHVHVLDFDRTLPLFVANGVLGVRDLGVPRIDEVLRWRAEAAAGRIVSPRIVTAGRLLDGDPSASPEYSNVVKTGAEARAAVRALKTQGVDCIKVYDVLSREAYFAIADEARRQNLPFVGHTPTAISTIEAADTGQRSIEHLGKILEDSSGTPAAILAKRNEPIPEGDYFAFTSRLGRVYDSVLATYSDDVANALFASLRRNGTWVVPTLAIKRGRAFIDALDTQSDPRAKYVPKAERDYWKPAAGFFTRYRTPEFIVAQERYYRRELELVGAMHRAGVRILAGTDTPNAYVIAGFGLHDELALLVGAGLTPMAALQSATRNPAEYLGELAQHGTLERDKAANMILLDANPIADISNTTRIAAVIQNGRYLSRQDLDQLLAAAEAIANKN